MSTRPRITRHLALFVLAVLGPSIVLIAFGARFIRQEQRLAETRLTEDRVHVAREFADALSAALDDAVRAAEDGLAQAGDRLPRYPADTVLRWLGTMQGSTYLAPWELDGHPDPDHPLSDPAHRRTMRRVTTAEYAAGSAAGVLGALLDRRPARIVIANRTVEKARRVRAFLFRMFNSVISGRG